MKMLILTALITHCVLQLTAGMSVGDFTQGSKREARDVGDPAPIDCTMTAWSDWGPCDPCTKIMHRSRGIQNFGQFGGKRCIEPIGDKKPCIPESECQEDPPPFCSTSEFQCESGVCIKKALACNEDYDCGDGDFSDEEECEKKRPPCGTLILTESDIGRSAGYGINILGSGPRMNPFNNKVYKGVCERVKEPTTLTYNRLPWNVAVLNYETLVEETSSNEVYTDTHQVVNEITSDITSKTSIGLSFKLTPTDSSTQAKSNENDKEKDKTKLTEFNAGFNVGTDRREMVTTVTDQTNTKGQITLPNPNLNPNETLSWDLTLNKSFYRVKGKVQLGTYRLRSRGLEVSQLFLDDVDALPIEYEKGQYFGFMEDYGTHYTKNGRAGGEYELIYVLNKNTKKDKLTIEALLKNCLKIGINADFQLTKGISGGLEKDKTTPVDDCKELKPKNTTETTSEALVDKVISSVKGGSPQSAAAMKSQLSKDGILDWNRYVDWARTLGDLPALIQSDPEPIYNAIPLDFPDVQARKENLYRALHEYMAEYSVCKCQPCQNGGTVAQIDGSCICLCPVNYEGLACQNARHDRFIVDKKPVEQLGNWGCWSSWSSCTEGRRRRDRSCNTGVVAGAFCKGDRVGEEAC